jgi:hypothetical protein
MTAKSPMMQEHLGDHLDGGEERLLGEILDVLMSVPNELGGTAPEMERVGHPQVAVGELAGEPLRRVLRKAVLHVRVANDVAGTKQERPVSMVHRVSHLEPESEQRASLPPPVVAFAVREYLNTEHCEAMALPVRSDLWRPNGVILSSV